MNEQIHQPDLEQLAEIDATCACSNVRKAARAVTQLFDEPEEVACLILSIPLADHA